MLEKWRGSQKEKEYAKERRETEHRYRMEAKNKEKEKARFNDKIECARQLAKSKASFEHTIMIERLNARDRKNRGLSCAAERQRLYDASIGMLLIEEAEYQLQQISAEENMGKALIWLDAALRQERKLDNSTSVANPGRISRNLEKIKEGRVMDELELPDGFGDNINSMFIDNLIAGMSFTECLNSTPHEYGYDVLYGTAKPDFPSGLRSDNTDTMDMGGAPNDTEDRESMRKRADRT